MSTQMEISRNNPIDPALAAGNVQADGGLPPFKPITLNRPERKNPLTFESYAELRDLFRALAYADDVARS